MLIHGKNPVFEALKAGRKIQALYVQENFNLHVFAPFAIDTIPRTILSKAKMDAQFPKGHQGIAAEVSDYTGPTLEAVLKRPGPKLFVMLDNVEDPHNLGAVIRNAEAFGVTAVIIPKHRSAAVTATVVKVSAGAIEHIDLITVTNLNQAVRTLKAHDVWVVGTDLDTDQTLEAIHADTDLAVVFGSEGKGLSRLLKSQCDYLVRIPMSGQANSLNVSVACGIVLYDILRRR
ncbi:MAG: 23S rRNA (guanosine(2251)-2'-O)-methyltransferase RlmB [Acholeplasmatales bacterium]|nr:MAG: 23S rRNA (guanosine(2251)-2'-O)-methyltransferase RlmB [Acholeplasmatales bacterium]